MNKQDQLEELLVDWGLQRQQGNELSAEELCKDQPELVPELSTLISDIKATDWLEEDDESDDDFLHLPDLSTVSNRADETDLPECKLSLEEFCQRLIDSELMDEETVEQFRQTISADDTRSFAVQLVNDQKLTRFQATVLLEGQDIPLVLDRYILLGEVGKGGMGVVYKALHQQMDRVVALKILPKEAVDSPEKVKRFHREVKAAAKLEHQNIVTAFDAREDKGFHFLVMSLVNGNDLFQIVRRQGPLSPAKSVDYIAQAARGLDHAHGMGIVHRDIKPGNLLLSKKGKVKILDMGLARIDGGDPEHGKTVSMELTQAGMVLGTIAYLAPEQALDTRHADARSDIYSLGCTLFYLLTGKAIYSEDTMMKTIMAHREGAIPSLCDKRDGLPAELDAVFQKMVAKQPEDRFQSMSEVVSALEELDIKDKEGTQPVVAGSQAHQDTATFIDTSRDVIEAAAAVSDKQPTRRWPLIAVGMLGVVAVLAGLIIKLNTPAGYVVLEIDQPEIVGAQVLIDGEKSVTIRTGNGEEQIRVTPDKERHQLEVQMAGFKTFTEEFTYDTGSNKKIKVTLAPLEAVAEVDEELKGNEGRQLAQPADPYAHDRDVAEWVLNSGGSVVVSDQSNGRKIQNIVDLPKGPFVLLSVQMSNVESISESEVADLSKSNGVSLLWLTNSDLTATDLSQFYQHPTLRNLSIAGTACRTSEFQPCPLFDNLTALVLAAEQIDDGWKFLRLLPRLRYLQVSVEEAPAATNYPHHPTLHTMNAAKISEEDLKVIQDKNPSMRVVVAGTPATTSGPGKDQDPLLFIAKELTQHGWGFTGYAGRTGGPKWDSAAKDAWKATGQLLIRRAEVPKDATKEDRQLLPRVALQYDTVDAEELSHADEFVPSIVACGMIGFVNLGNSDLTDTGLQSLARVSPTGVNVGGTEVTRAGVDAFKRQVPYCRVWSDYGYFEERHPVPFDQSERLEQSNSRPWPGDQPAPAVVPFTPEEAKQHQEAWAKHLGVPVETENSIGMKCRVIPPGEFMMGSSEEEIAHALKTLRNQRFREDIVAESPQHAVVITKPYAIGMHEVTRGQFRKFIDATEHKTSAERYSNGQGFRGSKWVAGPEFLWNTSHGLDTDQTDRHPVVNVSWSDAVEFCEWLSEKEHVTYRLPTEAEWEFACRSGSTSMYSFGNDMSLLSNFAWFMDGVSEFNTHAVGTKRENPFGLFDMHGNVWEKCQCAFAAYPSGMVVDPLNESKGQPICIRGGAFYTEPILLRSRQRSKNAIEQSFATVGFRIVRTFEKYEPRKPEAEGPAVALKPNESSEPEGEETRESDVKIQSDETLRNKKKLDNE